MLGFILLGYEDENKACGAIIVCSAHAFFLDLWINSFLDDYRVDHWAYNTGKVSALWLLDEWVGISYYNSSSVCLFVPCVLWGPFTDLRQTWWVYVGGPPICPWGVRFRKGQGVDGSTGHFRFPLYYVCASLTPHAATVPSALLWSSSRV